MTTQEALRETAFEILESGLFLFLAEGVAPTEPGPGQVFRMDIRGSREAEVGLLASEGAARLLASQMLGCEESEVGHDEASAASSEALNIVAGALLARTVGTDPELELCPPVAGGEPQGDVVWFDTDAGPMALWYLERAA